MRFWWLNCNRAEMMKKVNGQYFPEEVWVLDIELIIPIPFLFSLLFIKLPLFAISFAIIVKYAFLCNQAETVEVVRSTFTGGWVSAFQFCSSSGSQSIHLSDLSLIMFFCFLMCDSSLWHFVGSAPISFLPKIKMFVSVSIGDDFIFWIQGYTYWIWNS